MAVLHAVRVRPQGGTTWTVRESGIPEGTASHELSGLANGTWEEQVGVYLDTETVADATWSTTRVFTVEFTTLVNTPSVILAPTQGQGIILPYSTTWTPDAIS